MRALQIRLHTPGSVVQLVLSAESQPFRQATATTPASSPLPPHPQPLLHTLLHTQKLNVHPQILLHTAACVAQLATVLCRGGLCDTLQAAATASSAGDAPVCESTLARILSTSEVLTKWLAPTMLEAVFGGASGGARR